jgi:hypothetical protein
VIFNPTLAANWLDTRPLESLTAYRELTTRFGPVLAIDGNSLMMRKARQTGGSPSALPIHLTAGLQTFTNDRSPLPIASTVLRRHVPSTVRVWFRTRRRGVVIGCESDPAERGSHRWLPLIYVGRSGHVYGQYSTESDAVQASPGVITDGAWHQVVLVRTELGQTLYVDGVRAASTDHPVDAGTLGLCQVGAGASTGWPDAPDGVLRFVGDVNEVVLLPVAATADDVATDWAQQKKSVR